MDNAPEIDLYCERMTSAWFDEPLGLISNVAFLIAAFQLARHPGNRWPNWVLIALLICIGVGSGLFHAFATRLTLLLDVIPIQLFILAAIWILLRLHLLRTHVQSGLILIGFMGASALDANGCTQRITGICSRLGDAGHFGTGAPNWASTAMACDGSSSLSSVAGLSDCRSSGVSGLAVRHPLYLACTQCLCFVLRHSRNTNRGRRERYPAWWV